MRTGTKKAIKGTISAICILASASLIASLVYTGYNAYADATKVPVPVSNYTNNAAKKFPASEFVEKMLSEAAPGTDGELTRTPIATANMLPESCIQPDMPDSIVYARSASNKDYSIVVQAYGAGQGHTNFDSYVKKLSAACSVNMQSENSADMAKWDSGALMTAGDAVISVITVNKEKTDAIINWVKERMTSLLNETSCAAVNSTSTDAARSFYYDASKYKGLMQSEQVSTSKSIINNATPQSYTNAGGDVDAMYAMPALRDAPESPLPKNMPASLPTAPEKPVFSSRPTMPSSTANIDYQVSDKQGPGCGWAWAGQKSPEFNDSKLTAKYKEIKRNSIDALDSSVLAFNSAAGSWSLDSLWKTKFKAQWDDWIKNVNDVQAKWNDLESKRAAFKPTWDNYILTVYEWEMDMMNRKQAQTEWDDAVKNCVADKNNQWNANNAGKTPTDNDKKGWQSDCENGVGKPQILQQPEPVEPAAPSIPSDITMPNSWETASEAKARADADWKRLSTASNENSNPSSSDNGNTGFSSNGNNNQSNNGNNNGSIGNDNNANNGGMNGDNNNNSNGSIGGN